MRENLNEPEIQNTLNDVCAQAYEILANSDSPRFIKTHLPFSLMPSSVMTVKAKIIYVARHPKDVAVSWFYMNQTFRHHEFVDDFAKFWDYFEKGLSKYAGRISMVNDLICVFL